MKRHIIYVPGILDDIYHAQSIFMWFWRLLGVAGHCHEMPWAGEKSYASKFDELLKLIDHHLEAGHIVSLMGASAGASAVLNAYDVRSDRINSVVLISGKINRPEAVSERTYNANPAFRTAMDSLQGVLKNLTPDDTAKMLSFYSPIDVSVPHKDSIIPGVAERKLPSLKHFYAIIYSLTIKAPAIAKYLKQQAETVAVVY